MIGVLVHDSERADASEFFELCKTSWEFWQDDHTYSVVLSTRDLPPAGSCILAVCYRSRNHAKDPAVALGSEWCAGPTSHLYGSDLLPVYGESSFFPPSVPAPLLEKNSGRPTSVVWCDGGTQYIRVGYDLFHEVRFLLGRGQPVANALIPTLDRHIAVLRETILRAGLPFAEIPPVPAGYNLIACLSHDVDHPRLRNHCFDHTMFGFLSRALAGSVTDFPRRHQAAARLRQNWIAAAKLPFVHARAARDPWESFDRYVELEDGFQSTFFLIPEADRPGHTRRGPAPAMRACRYRLRELTPQIEHIQQAGSEVGLHGIDAWIDDESAIRERALLASAVGGVECGVRMHWLYFDENSPTVLDRAGFSYDSTVGFNQTVGFRAGTLQAYRPRGTQHLLELPLHLMDTALFYPNHLNLGDDEATRTVQQMLATAVRYGGALTVNWHDRSIAPERLWADFYLTLLEDLRRQQAWCPKMSRAAAWFRHRRSASVKFTLEPGCGGRVRASAPITPPGLPELQVRIYLPTTQSGSDRFARAVPVKIRTHSLRESLDEPVS